MKLYLLPGMGGDQRLFSNFNLPGVEKIVLNWKLPKKAKTLHEYAREMAEDIDTSEPFMLMGASMGAMTVVEMCKFLNPEHVILVSGAKTRKELPRMVRFWKWFPAYRIIPGSWLLFFAKLSAKRMGLSQRLRKVLFRDMLQVNGPVYLKHAIHFVVNWDNRDTPDKYIHVHGTKDRVLPHKNVSSDITVEDGTHFMILTRGREMSQLIADQLKAMPVSGDSMNRTSNKLGHSLPVT